MSVGLDGDQQTPFTPELHKVTRVKHLASERHLLTSRDMRYGCYGTVPQPQRALVARRVVPEHPVMRATAGRPHRTDALEMKGPIYLSGRAPRPDKLTNAADAHCLPAPAARSHPPFKDPCNDC